ncbi:unnamed protein product [Withania somnifera]
MEKDCSFKLFLVVLFLGVFVDCGLCLDVDSDAAVYIVTMKQPPVSHLYGEELRVKGHHYHHSKNHGSGNVSRLEKPSHISHKHAHNVSSVARMHDSLLRKVLRGEKYLKLYSYHYLINGFAVLVTSQQEACWCPPFCSLCYNQGIFNTTQDYASPFDGDGHGTHTASVAAGNHGIPVVVAGHHFGDASGMAPRAHIAVYKALYKSFGGFAADVVAAIDQAAQDGVDIINLSITPNRRPPGVATFFNPLDMALLSAVKAGIFVVQAAGNTGPSPKSVSSFSPWIFTVGASTHDRVYSNSIVLGNNITIPGVGLAPGTDSMYTLVMASHALNNTAANDMYVGECQDASSFNQTLVQGNLLVCSYSVRFVLGLSTTKQALETAKNLSAAGVVFCMDPFVIGFQINPTPMRLPGIIIPSANDSKILLQYYNSSLDQDEVTKKITRFGAVACISGGLKANFSSSAPNVMFYSARGPDPEDSFLDDADILKPNLVAPGNSIWAAWSSGGMDSIEFEGEDFAIMSGTSMAAPHVAGLAALIKQKFPNFSTAAIGSALSTTASLYDKYGGPILAQRSYANPDSNQSPATPFDMGSGFVNATAALDPGLIFDTGKSLLLLCVFAVEVVETMGFNI